MYITEPAWILTRLLVFSNGSKHLFFINELDFPAAGDMGVHIWDSFR